MTQRLAGKTAVVTGGSNGIGLKIVEIFVRHGAAVVFTGRDAERGRRAAETTGATFVRLDASDPDHADRLVAAARAAIGGIDILVNNAGSGGDRAGVETTTPDEFAATMAVHLRAPWFTIARAAPVMRGRGGGSIINICSVAGHRVGASSTAYAVAKAALLHLTHCAAAELGGDGIRVNSVSPGFIATSIHAPCSGVEPARVDKMVAAIARHFVGRQAIGRTGTPAEVADAVLFLASEESKFVTGADLVVDGGLMWGQSTRF
ncbi:MAG: SDR family oxidoreductase [Bradyrhizobium guangdongense]